MKRYPGKCWIYYPESRQELKLTCYAVLCLSQNLSKSDQHLSYHFANIYAKSEYFLNPYYRFIAQRDHNLIAKTICFAILAHTYICIWATGAFHTHPDLSHKYIVCLTNLKVYKRINRFSTTLSKNIRMCFPICFFARKQLKRSSYSLARDFSFYTPYHPLINTLLKFIPI